MHDKSHPDYDEKALMEFEQLRVSTTSDHRNDSKDLFSPLSEASYAVFSSEDESSFISPGPKRKFTDRVILALHTLNLEKF